MSCSLNFIITILKKARLPRVLWRIWYYYLFEKNMPTQLAMICFLDWILLLLFWKGTPTQRAMICFWNLISIITILRKARLHSVLWIVSWILLLLFWIRQAYTACYELFPGFDITIILKKARLHSVLWFASWIWLILLFWKGHAYTACYELFYFERGPPTQRAMNCFLNLIIIIILMKEARLHSVCYYDLFLGYDHY